MRWQFLFSIPYCLLFLKCFMMRPLLHPLTREHVVIWKEQNFGTKKTILSELLFYWSCVQDDEGPEITHLWSGQTLHNINAQNLMLQHQSLRKENRSPLLLWDPGWEPYDSISPAWKEAAKAACVPVTVSTRSQQRRLCRGVLRCLVTHTPHCSQWGVFPERGKCTVRESPGHADRASTGGYWGARRGCKMGRTSSGQVLEGMGKTLE